MLLHLPIEKVEEDVKHLKRTHHCFRNYLLINEGLQLENNNSVSVEI